MVRMDFLTMITKGSEFSWDHDSEFMWQEDAACRFQPYTLFEIASFEDAIAGGMATNEIKDLNATNFKRAQEICGTCPVFTECYLEADEEDFQWTVRAGILPTRFNLTPQGRPLKAVAVKAVVETEKGRFKAGEKCAKGHKNWSEKGSNGKRRCLTCRSEYRAKNAVKSTRVLKHPTFQREESCPKGHNEWRKKNGNRIVCAPCTREYGRNLAAKKKKQSATMGS